jgi:phosphate starvation-inducible protein PhoH
MAKKNNSSKKQIGVTYKEQRPKRNFPETFDNRPYFGLELDEEQRAYRDAIWSKDKLIVFCNSVSGTGKTTLAVMTAELLVQSERYDGIVYITAPVQEERIGFLPGSAQEKTLVYCEPFYEAAVKAGINVYTAVKQEQPENISAKFDTAYIDLRSHNYLRGITFDNKVIIIDEAQNFYLDELKKTLTRITDNCKTIVIGHTGQCDLLKRKENAGFARAIELFKDKPFASVNYLTHNYRGIVSSTADEL